MAKLVKGGQGMNPLFIVLGVIVFIIIAYLIYSKWFSGVNNLASGQINLKTTTPPTPVLASTLTNQTSTRYSYGIWVYVNTWDNTIPKVIFSRYNDVVLYLDKNSAVLNCIISPVYTKPPATDALIDLNTASTTPTNSNNAINITNNFPLQKWVFITIVVDNQIVDFYLDGKMVKSLNIPQVQPDSTSNIYYGYGFDAVVTNFQRWPSVLDPQSVYNYYVSGSSSVGGGSATGGYHATVTITQNNSPSSSFNLF
jgi:Concanavalin A-like lectin/glucanases superfamily